jgi:AbrB family looped-hinge helix DNA binding protein
LRAATTRVSSKGQVVIPEAVRKTAGVSKGEDLLVVVIGDTIVMKKLSALSFEEVAKPIWRTVRAMGLSGEELDELIEQAKSQATVASKKPTEAIWGLAQNVKTGNPKGQAREAITKRKRLRKLSA